MPEATDPIRVFSLLEVTESIRRTISSRYGSLYWIQAEMIKLNPYPHSGHCFPELAEKREGKVLARMRSVLWRDDYQRINARFRSVLGEPLKDGIKILLQARIVFDPLYGVSLQIVDIDPGYTLGDLEREKRETLARLEREGLLDRNRSLRVPLLPARVAVISVETSKGYADFTRVLDHNPAAYGFFHMLFPAVLQGPRAVETMIGQLRRIGRAARHFDVVAIIRGGGDDLGFSCYNDYTLAREVALCPLPVFTGIGHATNETVVDIVAAANAITPTKMAEDLIARFQDFDRGVREAQTTVMHRAERILTGEINGFRTLASHFRAVTGGSLIRHRTLLAQQSVSVSRQAGFLLHRAREAGKSLAMLLRRGSGLLGLRTGELLSREEAAFVRGTGGLMAARKQALDHLGKNVANLDPLNVLRRGYSITLVRGKAVRTAEEVVPGEEIETRLYRGTLSATVHTTRPEKTGNHE